MAATTGRLRIEGTIQRSGHLILVTVGTHNQGFNRLVQSADALAAELDERVVIQRGSSTYEPCCAELFQMTTNEHMAQLTQAARLIVTHAGAGSIILAMTHQKPLVLIPRLKRLGESLDDHQWHHARALAEQGRAVVVDEVSAVTLRAAIEQAARQHRTTNGATQLIHALQNQLTAWENGSRVEESCASG